MPENNGSPLGKFADAVRKQLREHEDVMHKQDIRITKIEDCETARTKYSNLFWKVLAVFLTAIGLVIAYLALR